MKITAQPVENAADLDPGRTLSVDGAVRAVAFCPCKWNSSLLAVGTASEVTVFSVKLPDEDPGLKSIEASVVRCFSHVAPVQCIAWSPNMSLVLEPVWMRLATASLDNNVRLFYTNLKEEDEVKVLTGHKGPVNAVAFEPQSGQALASVGDDNTCRIWGVDGEQQARLLLRSPGTALAWHPEEVGKLLVAEKRGTLRFYNASTGQPLMSLETGQPGLLLSVDWSLCNSLLLGAVAGPHCFLWESARSSRPLDQKPVHPSGATNFAFSHIQEEVCATRGHPGNAVKVLNLKTAQVLLSQACEVGCGISWHHKHPVLAYGGDGRVHIARVTSF
ncbi:hypothetical protein HPB48_016096 [Haemaphysalis longicornis]|uniref:Nucleoporin Nup37 n=1 Tax=Haemaphysalis longicornis TaxID=44386 RepID=A0A9J6H043_HAELO|nr:hypothetical protein HPB48_016096 [Haemaphysalis longicornis]